MRDVGEPVSIVQCTEALRDVFSELKKPDGSAYKGTLERAIHGALWSTGVFRKTGVRVAWPTGSHTLPAAPVALAVF